jgi:hypothetical protein
MDDLTELHSHLREIFSKNLIEPEGERSFACKMFDVMTDNKDTHENCLGENFNQLIQTLKDDFFINYSPSSKTKMDFYFTTYVLWLYLIVERIDFVFDVVNKDNRSKLFSDFKEANFKSCQLIKKWANFIKHPKEFIFSHWPQYIMNDSGTKLMMDSFTVVIDNEFVKKHYTKPESRVVELENCDRVIVFVPNLIKLTADFCNELNIFFDFICDNKLVADFLKRKTTIEYYYEPKEGETPTFAEISGLPISVEKEFIEYKPKE